MNEHDGGPALPQSQESWGQGMLAPSGMSLRDYFAGKALNGLCANEKFLIVNAMAGASGAKRGVAEAAYEFADAMLALRGKEAKP